MHVLLLAIGSGQAELTGEKFTYRTGKYVSESEPEGVCVETPFVGDAITKLYSDEKFDRVVILGTKDSMWSTLYAHALDFLIEVDKPGEIEYFQQINALAEGDVFSFQKDHLPRISEKYARMLGVPVNALIIPLGVTETEQWEIFSAVIASLYDADAVSLDITHSLRYHPMIMNYAVFYKKITNPGFSVRNVFYGAFELSSKYNGKAPILKLSIMNQILEWSLAAYAFNTYSNTRPVSELLSKAGFDDNTVNPFKNFANTQQLIIFQQIHSTSKNLLAAIQRIQSAEKKLPAFDPVAVQMREILTKMPDMKLWEIMMERSLLLWKADQLGLAILTLWEALIERIAIANQVPEMTYELYHKYSLIFSKSSPVKKIIKEQMPHFYNAGKALKGYRDKVAHAESSGDTVASVIQNFEQVYESLHRIMTKDGFDTMLQTIVNYEQPGWMQKNKKKDKSMKEKKQNQAKK